MVYLLLPGQYYFLVGGVVLFLGYPQIALLVNAALTVVSQIWVCVILAFGVGLSGQTVSERALSGKALSGKTLSEKVSNSEPVLSRHWALGYSLLLAFLFSALLLPVLGLMPATETSQYRTVIQVAVPFALMALIVHLRQRRLERQQQRQVLKAEQEAASEKSRRQDSEQFLAMLTHEIRTPLTVMAYASKTDLPEGQLTEHVKSGVREIDDLIERCIQADRADQVSLSIVPTQTSFEALLEAFRARFFDDRIDWQMTVPAAQSIVIDLTLFEVVLHNLVDNALKYSPNQTRVNVDIYPQARDGVEGWVVVVSNTPGAVGFPDTSRLFQKYYRAPRAHIRTGSGLGLYVARSFALKLSGQLSYHESNELVRFELWLPF